jgi:preprotein translocase subunit SecE
LKEIFVRNEGLEMDNTNSKIITLSFAVTAAIVGFTTHLLIKAFAAAFGIVARFADTDLVRHGLPVAVGLGLFVVLQFNKNILAWADEVVVEIRKVVFPSRKDTTAMTIVVVVMVLISSVVITTFDFVSGYVLNMVMK